MPTQPTGMRPQALIHPIRLVSIAMLKLILILVVSILMLTLGSTQILQITIILPPSLILYYEWLLEFPGWQTTPKGPVTIEIASATVRVKP